MIENQKNSSFNPLLSSTSRQFYTRRLPQRQHSNAQLDKVLRVLNSSQGDKIQRKFKTESREADSHFDSQLDNLKKMAKVKLQAVIRKSGKQWKQLFESFQNYSKSTSKEILLKNEINFVLKMSDIITKITKKSLEQNEKLKIKRDPSKMMKVKDKVLETVKLSKQNEILRQKLSIFQNSPIILDEQHLRTDELKFSSEELMEESEQTRHCLSSKMLSDLKEEVQILRETNDMLRDEKKKLQEKILQLKSSNENLCEEIVKIRYFSSESNQKFEKWRNIMLMQNEQINGLKRDLQDFKKEYNDLNRKYHNILKRFSSLSNKDQTRITEITKKNVEVFNEQIEAFRKIRNGFMLKGYYQTQGSSRERGVNFYQRYLGEKESVSNAEGIKKVAKDYYRYYKPSFFVFLEQYFEYQGVDRQNFDQIGLPVDMTFLATLRSILDSKFNEYLLNSKATRYISSLPNFTLSWLSNFMVDRKAKQQIQITTDVCFETIGGFYIRLMSPNLNNNWQVITFRQFLLESLTVDELIFYLKIRFLLLKGDGMTGKGAFMPIFYVNYVDALILIQEIVSDFDYRKKLEDYLKRAAEYHRKNHLIDAHFILRLLLEYYQFKKQEIFTNLAKAFSPYLKDRNISMPFQVFLKIFDYNSFELSLIEMVQIFQKAFSLGRGSVYLENIFTVINEEGFLCREVEKMFHQHPVGQQKEVSMHLCDYDKKQTAVDELQLFFQKSLNNEISGLGVQSQKNIISRLIQEKNLTAEGILLRIQTIVDISIFNIKKLLFSKSIKKFAVEELTTLVPVWLPFLKGIVKDSIEKKQSLRLLENFLKKEAAKQILHFYRRKKFLIRSFMSNCEQKDKANEHAIEVRKEFNTLIQNLKMKYNNNVSLSSEKEVDYDEPI